MGMDPTLLKSIASSQATGAYERTRDGEYDLTITSVKFKNNHSGRCFIAEHIIDGSKAVFEDITPNAPGTTLGEVVNFDGKGKQSAMGNVKAYFLGVLGYQEHEVNADKLAEIMEAALNEDPNAIGQIGGNAGKKLAVNPLKGLRVRMTTVRKVTTKGENTGTDEKGRGKFIARNFKAIPGQDEATVAARAAELAARGL